MRKLGVGSLPIGILIAAFMGIVLALLASYSFTNSVPRYLVGTLVQKTVMMELAPVLTGLALAGRVGASIAAEIGTMRVTEQVDALETLAYDPDRLPRGAAHAVGARDVPGGRGRGHDGGTRRRMGGVDGAARPVVGAVSQGRAVVLRRVRCAIRPGEGGEFRRGGHRGGVRLRPAGARRFRGRGRGGHQGRRHLGGAHSRSRCVLGGRLAAGEGHMKKRSNDFLLGAVILGAIALIVAVSLFLRETDIGTKRSRVTARFRDVGQVQVGNVVVIRGVKAGKVEAIELADEGWVHVRLALDAAVELPPRPRGAARRVVAVRRMAGDGHRTAVGAEQPRGHCRSWPSAAGGTGTLPGAVLPDVAQLTTVAGGIAGDVASVAQRFQVAFNDSAARELRASIRSVSAIVERPGAHGAGAVEEPRHRVGGRARRGGRSVACGRRLPEDGGPARHRHVGGRSQAHRAGERTRGHAGARGQRAAQPDHASRSRRPRGTCGAS